MRIGIVAGEYPPMQGGVGAYTRILAQELVRQGHKVFILSTSAAREAEDEISLSNSVRSWGLPSLLQARRWAEAERLDVVNIQFQTAAFQMSPWIHFLPMVMRETPVVTTFHDLRYPYLFPKAGRLRDWIVMCLARTSDGLIVTNHEDFQRVEGLRNVRLIPIGSNILNPLEADFDQTAWRSTCGAESGDFLLAFFGLVNRSKGLETLLDSVARLRMDGIPVRLVMVGDVGTSDPTNVGYSQEIDALIEKLGIRSLVHRTGFLARDEEVGAFLTASDVVVLPFLDGASFRRGSLMAAIHYGCPIVTTRPQVQIPVFVDGDNMLFVCAGSSDVLAAALRRLYEQSSLRERLRGGARKLARLFDWKQIALDYTNFLYWIIEEGAKV